MFPFSEINAAVFQNAAIFLRTSSSSDDFHVFCPPEIMSLYFHAKEITPVYPPGMENYSEVSNYSLPPFRKHDPRTWYSPQILNFLWQKSINVFPKNLYSALPESWTADYKMRRFLFRNGLYAKCKAQVGQGVVFLGTARHLDLASMKRFQKPGHVPWDVYFENLFQMIIGQGVSSSLDREKFHLKWLQAREEVRQLDLFHVMQDFIHEHKNVVFLRTRNISGAASVHNTNLSFLSDLVHNLLVEGFAVLSSGTPPMQLPIDHSRYLEIHHNLPIASQQEIAKKCDYIITSAEAGLFTAWASTDLPLVTFGSEWSISNTKKGISLLSARKEIGLSDKSINYGLRGSSLRSEMKRIL